MLHANNGNVPFGNDLRAGPGNYRGVARPNENIQLLRPNNCDVVYNNDDEYHDIIDEDEDEDDEDDEDDEIEEEEEDEDEDEDDDVDDDLIDGDEIHRFRHPNHNSDDDEDAPNPIINHHRHDNHFNHNRR